MTPQQREKLVTCIIRHDRRREASDRRHGYRSNPHALPLMLQALDRAAEDMASTGCTLRSALCRAFSDRLRDQLLRAVGEPIATDEEIRTENRRLAALLR